MKQKIAILGAGSWGTAFHENFTQLCKTGEESAE